MWATPRITRSRPIHVSNRGKGSVREPQHCAIRTTRKWTGSASKSKDAQARYRSEKVKLLSSNPSANRDGALGTRLMSCLVPRASPAPGPHHLGPGGPVGGTIGPRHAMGLAYYRVSFASRCVRVQFHAGRNAQQPAGQREGPRETWRCHPPRRAHQEHARML